MPSRLDVVCSLVVFIFDFCTRVGRRLAVTEINLLHLIRLPPRGKPNFAPSLRENFFLYGHKKGQPKSAVPYKFCLYFLFYIVYANLVFAFACFKIRYNVIHGCGCYSVKRFFGQKCLMRRYNYIRH